MKPQIIRFSYLLFFTFLTFNFSALNAHANFDEMIVFGDSLSDTGNLSSVQGSFPNPPFFESSRVSNGPVAVEGLAAKLGLDISASLHLVGGNGGGNFAVARASAAGDTPIDLVNQVGAYLQKVGGNASANALYVMFIGGNDVRSTRELSLLAAKKLLNEAVEAIDQQLRLLIASGAQHILVVNSPDIGTTPEVTSFISIDNDQRLVKNAKLYSRYFNKQLAKKVKHIEHDTQRDLVLFDLLAYFEKLSTNATALGYTNVTDACFSTVNLSFNPACNLGQRFDEFLFFDEIHPTGRTHERMSRALFAEVPEKLN